MNINPSITIPVLEPNDVMPDALPPTRERVHAMVQRLAGDEAHVPTGSTRDVLRYARDVLFLSVNERRAGTEEFFADLENLADQGVDDGDEIRTFLRDEQFRQAFSRMRPPVREVFSELSLVMKYGARRTVLPPTQRAKDLLRLREIRSLDVSGLREFLKTVSEEPADLRPLLVHAVIKRLGQMDANHRLDLFLDIVGAFPMGLGSAEQIKLMNKLILNGGEAFKKRERAPLWESCCLGRCQGSYAGSGFCCSPVRSRVMRKTW